MYKQVDMVLTKHDQKLKMCCGSGSLQETFGRRHSQQIFETLHSDLPGASSVEKELKALESACSTLLHAVPLQALKLRTRSETTPEELPCCVFCTSSSTTFLDIPEQFSFHM